MHDEGRVPTFEYMDIKLRIRGAIFGHLIGDAVGTQYLKRPSPNPSASTTSQLLARSYSYPGAMTLCTMASINDSGNVDLDDIAHKTYEWYLGSYLSPPATTDSRITISKSIRLYAGSMPPDRCGSRTLPADNTALIRTLPIALWNLTESNEKLIQQAHLASSFTNNQIESKVLCSLYCLAIKRILLEETGEKISLELEKYYDENGMKDAIKVIKRIKSESEIQGTNEVLDSFKSSWKIFNNSNSDYETVITEAIKLQNDCNTTACIAGSLSGAYLGENEIPQRWLNQFDLPGEAKQVVNQFIALTMSRL